MAEATDIDSKLKYLVELQRITSQLYDLEAKKARLPRKYKHIEDEYQLKKKVYDSSKKDLEHIAIEEHGIQGELEKIEAELSRLKEKEKVIRTQREFEAILTERETRELSQQDFKKKLKELSDKKTSSEATIQSNEEAIKKLESQLNDEKAKIQGKLDDLDNQIIECEKKKQVISPHLPEKVIKDYEYIAAHKNGLGIVQIFPGGICEGCNIRLTPAILNEVKRGEDFVRCPNCSRYLYFKTSDLV